MEKRIANGKKYTAYVFGVFQRGESHEAQGRYGARAQTPRLRKIQRRKKRMAPREEAQRQKRRMAKIIMQVYTHTHTHSQ